MQRVLFVTDNFTKGGLETRIAEQVEVYRRKGVEAFLIAENLGTGAGAEGSGSEAGGAAGADFYGFTATKQLVMAAQDARVIHGAAEEIIKFAKKHKIEAIDCHPLYCMIPAAIAAARLHIPISYTIHGEYSLFPSEDWKAALTNLILRNGVQRVYVVAEYLRAEVYKDVLEGAPVKVARNGLLETEHAEECTKGDESAEIRANFTKGEKNSGEFSRHWAFASRLTEKKIAPLVKALPLLKKAGVREIDIFGEGEAKKSLEEERKDWPKLNFCGWTEDFRKELEKREYGGVIGMGRVAEEALVAGVPVIILGYGGVVDAIREETLEKYLAQNFTSWEEWSETKIVTEVKKVLKKPEEFVLQEKAAEVLDAEKLWEEYLDDFSTLERTELQDQAMRALGKMIQDEAELRGYSEQLYKRVFEIEGSKTWRMTEPLRKAFWRIRNLGRRG